MNGPENFWEGLGAFGSVASLFGLAVAVWAELRARRAERRAESAEAKVDAAVAQTRTAGDVRGLAVAYTAGPAGPRRNGQPPRLGRVRRPVAEGAGNGVRVAGPLRRGPPGGAADRRLPHRPTHRDPRSDRTLSRAADMIDRLNARSLRRLTEPPR